MNTICQFSAIGPKKQHYDVSLAADEIRSASEITFHFSIEGEGGHKVTITFDGMSGGLTFSSLHMPNVTPFVACLITCGLGHIGKEILECLKAGHRKPKDLWNCLRSKGVSISLALAQCALKCAGSAHGTDDT